MPDSPVMPRVLVLGQPFERATGGGITMSNLFAGWPCDHLACAAVAGPELRSDVCTQFYLLGRDEIAWVWPLSLAGDRETRPSGRYQPVGSDADAAGAPSRARAGADEASGAGTPAQDRALRDPAGSSARRRGRALFRTTVSRLGALDLVRGMHASDGLRQWIREFRPDVVYSQLSDLPVMSLVDEVLRDTHLPVALHVMDDWPQTMYRHGALAPLARHRAERLFASLLARARSRMAIGDAMAREYERRYGFAFVGVQNAIDLAERDAQVERHAAAYPRDPGSRVVVLYAGRIGTANAASIRLVAETVDDMARHGAGIELRIHTTDAGQAADLSVLQGVEVLSPVPYDHMPALLASADVLLLPLDFDEDSRRFAGLSMPTKIPEYRAAGRCVLTVAPADSAAGTAAASGGWSILVDEPDRDRIRSALAALAGDRALRDEMGARGRRIAEVDHDAHAVRALFADELRRAAYGPPSGDRQAHHAG